MHHPRPTAIAAMLLAVLPAAALSSCGFDYPTDRVNQVAAGANNRDASVDVLGARIVATADGKGRLIGTLVNNESDDAELVAVTAPGGDASVEFEPVVVAGDKAVNLAAEDGPVLPVSGEFAAGEVVELTFAFSTDEKVTENVPVVKHCFYYTEVAPGDSAAAEETDHAEEESTDNATDEHASEGDQTYLCEHPTEVGGEEGGH